MKDLKELVLVQAKMMEKAEEDRLAQAKEIEEQKKIVEVLEQERLTQAKELEEQKNIVERVEEDRVTRAKQLVATMKEVNMLKELVFKIGENFTPSTTGSQFIDSETQPPSPSPPRGLGQA